jgi:hypothetical protein
MTERISNDRTLDASDRKTVRELVAKLAEAMHHLQSRRVVNGRHRISLFQSVLTELVLTTEHPPMIVLASHAFLNSKSRWEDQFLRNAGQLLIRRRFLIERLLKNPNDVVVPQVAGESASRAIG